jgi:DNA replication protein DnaC
MQREKLAALEQLSNLGALTRMTFDTLSPQGRRGDAASQKRFTDALESARSFAAQPEGWLVIIGPAGFGKTHLAAAVANDRIRQGHPAFYVTAAELLDHLRQASLPGADLPQADIFNQVKSAPLLVLDDLDLDNASPWGREKIEQLLNHRFNARMPTIVTASQPLEKMDDRLRARFSDTAACRVVVLEESVDPVLERIDSMGLQLLRNMTFKTFDYNRADQTPAQRNGLETACKAAMRFAESPQGWLVFHGVSGTGKTHLAAAIANYRREAGKPCVFVYVLDLLGHLRSAFNPESKVSHDELFEAVKKAPLLILDGLDGQKTTDWALEKLRQLLNYRFNDRLPTVITTLLTADTLPEWDDRIAAWVGDTRFSNPVPISASSYTGTPQPPGNNHQPAPRRPRNRR